MADEPDGPFLSVPATKPLDNVVLIAVDGSDSSFYSFKWYMQNIHQPFHNIVILHCPEIRSVMKIPLRAPDSDSVRSALEEHDLEMTNLVDRIKDNLRHAKVNARLITQSGNPGHTIVEIANENKAILIVTGSRGVSRIRRTLIGSVSDFVLHHAHCPVLICPKENAT
ncbi:universal stress protein a-like protein [Plakobranchus ocellatus]|uniref:Universal stress protein a-like protein n=1 Tax=Plakobranchus ocellatus TaxID=259542 RepID=A0AAV4DIT5_9GAST|nr:universal stress protein a-like protein [Plakobranchus ocellatus]